MKKRNRRFKEALDLKVRMGKLRIFLEEYYPLLSILVGYFLVAITIGPFHNGDTAWEFDAVLGIFKTGLPVANGVEIFSCISGKSLSDGIQASKYNDMWFLGKK